MSKLPRIIVIGLDGAPYKLIKTYTEKGLMPHLRSVIEQGSLHQMDTVLPEVSAAAWSSFMTGKNPAKTGIFGFFDMMPGSYSNVFTNYMHLKQSPLWNIMHKETRRPSVVINMPSTFPAKPMNGVLISGFVAPDIKKSVYPPALLPLLSQMRYKIDLDIKKLKESPELLISEAFETLDLRARTVDMLWSKVDWQLFSCIITGTDRLQHFLMDAFENENHLQNKLFEEYYRRVDFFLGTIVSRLKENDLLIILSDHGFEVTSYEVYLNVFFKQKGWLEDVGYEKNCFENLTEKTLAFSLDPARIYINKKPRYPRGNELTEEAYNNLLNDIKQELQKLRTPDGMPVIRQIVLKEDYYTGKFVDYAPDLLLVGNEGISFKGSLKPEEIFMRPDSHTGVHNAHDAFLACNYPMLLGRKPNIMDLTPTILSQMKINLAPYDFDGIPITIDFDNN